MKIKDIALSAAYVGQRAVKAICVGAQEVWSAIKYIVFKDPVVEQICATNWGDGKGITEEQAAAVTDLGTVFKGNTEITSFNELSQFTGLKSIGSATTWDKYSFGNCTNLREVSIPSEVEILGNAAFQGCSSLVRVEIPRDNHIKQIGSSTFDQCANLVIEDLYLPNLSKIGTNIFNKVQLKKISSLGSVSSISAQNTFGSVVEEVVLPPTCKTLGSGVFRDCKKLRAINLENVETFGNYALLGCSSLAIDINYPTLTKFGGLSVFDSADIRSVNMPMLEVAEQGTFNQCKNLIGELSFPNLKGEIGRIWMSRTSITKILNLGEATAILGGVNAGAFSDCSKLTYANIPPTMTRLGEYAFQGCSLLETIIFNSVTPPTLDNVNAFWNNPLMTIYVPDQSVTAYREASGWSSYADKIWPMEAYLYGIITFADPAVEAICLANWDTNGSGYLNKEEAKAVTNINYKFQENTNIVSFDELEYFTKLKSVGTYAFAGCSNLSSIRLPESIDKIERVAFMNCSSLTSLEVPPMLNFVGDNSFFGCSKMKEIHIDSVEHLFAIEYDRMSFFSGTGSSLNTRIYVNGDILTSVEIPSCSKIPVKMFYRNIDLTSVVIAEGATTIESGAFEECTNISSSITIPSSVRTIGSNAFNGCKNVQEFILSEGVTELGTMSFSGCKAIDKMILPSTITSIGGSAFYDTTFNTFICKAVEPPVLSQNILLNATNIYVPDASVDAYKGATNWSPYEAKIKPLSQYVEPTNE